MKIGYARVSSTGQNLEAQIELLKQAGCEKIFTEKKSGRQMNNRTVLRDAMDFCRESDTFVVSRLDRCSRSVKDLHIIIDSLTSKGVHFKATEQDIIDTSTSTGRLIISILSSINSFQIDVQREMQMDGIKNAQRRGVKFGRESRFNQDKTIQAIEMQSQGMTNQEISDEFEIGRSTLLRYISSYKKKMLEVA